VLPSRHFRATGKPPRAAIGVLALLLAGACQSTQHAPASTITLAPGVGVVGAGSAAAIAAADRAAAEFAPADVDFMQGMIPHHAQAVIMARWAQTHGARADVMILCRRIVIAQTDEIRLMRNWLGERKQEVPDSLSTKHVMKMNGMTHEMLMPGMLTDEQMKALDAARGSEFDRLFLTGMIGHHRGAIAMVRELFSHGDAGHDDTVFKFASDVEADQTAEIHKMELMLETVP
jgi:uncharacterized protein (DUF305 family)